MCSTQRFLKTPTINFCLSTNWHLPGAIVDHSVSWWYSSLLQSHKPKKVTFWLQFRLWEWNDGNLVRKCSMIFNFHHLECRDGKGVKVLAINHSESQKLHFTHSVSFIKITLSANPLFPTNRIVLVLKSATREEKLHHSEQAVGCLHVNRYKRPSRINLLNFSRHE